jgi:hypothetical protein
MVDQLWCWIVDSGEIHSPTIRCDFVISRSFTDTVVTFFSGTDGVLENLELLKPRDKNKNQGNRFRGEEDNEKKSNETNDSRERDPADVRRLIYERLTDHPRIPSECTTCFDLVAVIILSAVTALLGGGTRLPLDHPDLDVQSLFEEYISKWVRLLIHLPIIISSIVDADPLC